MGQTDFSFYFDNLTSEPNGWRADPFLFLPSKTSCQYHLKTIHGVLAFFLFLKREVAAALLDFQQITPALFSYFTLPPPLLLATMHFGFFSPSYFPQDSSYTSQ